MNLETCKRFWHRIYHIQRRDVYSFYEIEKLVKDVENIKDEGLEKVLDEFYSDMDLQKRIQFIDHLRSIFHRPLKKAEQNPLNSERRNKLMKRSMERISL